MPGNELEPSTKTVDSKNAELGAAIREMLGHATSVFSTDEMLGKSAARVLRAVFNLPLDVAETGAADGAPVTMQEQEQDL